jgi:hypothetical protein
VHFAHNWNQKKEMKFGEEMEEREMEMFQRERKQ